MTRSVVVVGLGYFSRFHLDAWQAQEGVALVGVHDLDRARRDRAAAAYDVPAAVSVEGLLSTTAPEIVDIVAPPAAHAHLVRAALAPGRIVICQKPFCTSLDEAEAVTREAEAGGAHLAIHENFRFQPWHRTIKAFLDDGRMGQVFQAGFALRPGDGRGPDAYLDRQPSFRSMPRLLIHETGVHFVDLFRWMFGEIDAVFADLRRLNPAIAGEDAGLLILDHASGAQTVFDGNRMADHETDSLRRTMGEMEVVGAAGTLRLDGSGRVRFRAFGAAGWEEIRLVQPVDEAAFGGGCVAALISHVAENAATPERIENHARDYLPVIRATEAAYRSAESGRKISLRGTRG